MTNEGIVVALFGSPCRAEGGPNVCSDGASPYTACYSTPMGLFRCVSPTLCQYLEADLLAAIQISCNHPTNGYVEEIHLTKYLNPLMLQIAAHKQHTPHHSVIKCLESSNCP